MAKVLAVAVGGAVGAVLRYLVSGWTQRMAGPAFPAGTLAVNVIGCLLLGFLGAAFSRYVLVRDEWRLVILVGGLGAFTTYSTYGYETVTLINEGQRWYALVNVVASNAAGLTAVWAGYRLAERWYGG